MSKSMGPCAQWHLSPSAHPPSSCSTGIGGHLIGAVGCWGEGGWVRVGIRDDPFIKGAMGFERGAGRGSGMIPW